MILIGKGRCMEQTLQRRIRIIPAMKPQTQAGGRFSGRKQRVAAYFRVSTDSEEQLTSWPESSRTGVLK